MKKILTLLSLLFLLPVALATTLTATSPLASNSVIQYSGACSSAGTVGIQISFSGNMVHFDQLTGSPNFASSSSSTPYTATTDGDYTISASCAGEASASATVCVSSNCPTGESSESSSGSSGGGSGRPLVVVGSSKDSSSTGNGGDGASKTKAAAGSDASSGSTAASGSSEQQEDENKGSGLLFTLILIALLAGGGYFLWKKYKKPQGYAPMPQTQ